MLRRAANRDSARRVRDRRNDELHRLVQKVSKTGSMEDCHADAAASTRLKRYCSSCNINLIILLCLIAASLLFPCYYNKVDAFTG